MSALIHTLADGKKKEKKRAARGGGGGGGGGEAAGGKRGAHWDRQPPAPHPLPLPPPSSSSPALDRLLRFTARAVKNLITKKFWHSVSLVLVAIYRPEFRLSPSLALSLYFSLRFYPTRLLISPFLSLFLSLPNSQLRSRAYLWFIRARLEPHTGHPPSFPSSYSPPSTIAPPHPYWPPTLFIKRRYIIFY